MSGSSSVSCKLRTIFAKTKIAGARLEKAEDDDDGPRGMNSRVLSRACALVSRTRVLSRESPTHSHAFRRARRSRRFGKLETRLGRRGYFQSGKFCPHRSKVAPCYQAANNVEEFRRWASMDASLTNGCIREAAARVATNYLALSLPRWKSW